MKNNRKLSLSPCFGQISNIIKRKGKTLLVPTMVLFLIAALMLNSIKIPVRALISVPGSDHTITGDHSSDTYKYMANPTEPVMYNDTDNTVDWYWGNGTFRDSTGSHNGKQYFDIYGLALDRDYVVYLLQIYNDGGNLKNRVIKIASQSDVVLNTYNIGNIQLSTKAGLNLDSDGNIYVTDTSIQGIIKIDPTTYAESGGLPTAGVTTFIADAQTGGTIYYPQDIAIDVNNKMYILQQSLDASSNPQSQLVVCDISDCAGTITFHATDQHITNSSQITSDNWNIYILASGGGGLWMYDGTYTFRATEFTGNAAYLDVSYDKNNSWDKKVYLLNNNSGAVKVEAYKTLAPANDNIANAMTLTIPSTIRNANLGGTMESGETTVTENPDGATVWFKYTATDNQTVTFDTCQTPNEDQSMYVEIRLFDATNGTGFGDLAYMTPYTKDVNSGTAMTCGSEQRSQTYDLTAGTVYYLLLRGGGSSQDNYILNVTDATGPSNDNFLSPRQVGGSEYFEGDTTNATMETGEPGVSGGKTVWFDFYFSNTSGVMNFDTCSDTTSDFLWEKHLYTSSTGDIADAVLVTPSSTVACGDNQNTVSYNINEHTKYYLQLRGSGSNAGAYQLNLVANLKPVNDDFADSFWFDSPGDTFDGNSNNGTMESGEPTTAGGKTVWFFNQTSISRSVSIDSCDVRNELIPEFYVYTGSAVSALSNVSTTTQACPDGLGTIYSFYEGAGIRYNFQIRGSGTDSGYYIMHWLLSAPTGTPIDTTNTGGTITSSGDTSDQFDDNAFDDDPNTRWYNEPATGNWIQYTYPGTDKYIVTSYTITSADDEPGRDPQNFYLEGWDGTDWYVLDSQVNQSNHRTSNVRETNIYNFSNTTGYRAYRLTFTKVASACGTNAIQMNEIEFIGIPGAGDSPAPSTVKIISDITEDELGTVTVSGYEGNETGLQAFDSRCDTLWYEPKQATHWIEYAFTDNNNYVATSYTILAAPESGSSVDPKDFLFQGYDGSTWTTLDTRTDVTFPNRNDYIKEIFTFSNTTGYQAYRLYITNPSNGESDDGVKMKELHIMGYAEEVTPTATPTATPTSTPELTPTPGFASSTNIPTSYVSIGLPTGMVMLPDGNIWYVDRLNWRIVLFNPSTNTILRTVGRLGFGEGEFNEGIIDITVDNEGYLYALHMGCLVSKFDANGGFIGLYNLHDTNSTCHDTTTEGITYDTFSGTLLVTDYGQGTVNKYSKVLIFISSFGSNGSGTGEFNEPKGIDTDSSGNIYVADRGNNRVQVFASDYSHMLTISGPWTNIGGTTNFDWLTDVNVLSDGTITISSSNARTIEQFAANGAHIRTWPIVTDVTNPAFARTPEYLAKDASNNVYVTDTWVKAISKYSSTGTFISSLRNATIADGKFYFPTDLTYCPDGNMYVTDGADADHSRVQEFSNSGTWLATILEVGTEGLGNVSQNLTCDATGRLWVSSEYDVRIFEKNGSTWGLIKTIDGHFNGDRGGGGLGGIAINGDDVYVPNIQDSDIMKYTLNHGTDNYDYISSFGGGWSWEDRNADPQIQPAIGQLKSPYSVVMDSRGHFFVPDWASLKEFDANGTFIKNLGVGYVNFQTARGVSIDPVNDHIYLTDSYGYEVDEYDNITGAKLNTIGSPDTIRMGGGYWSGSGQMQFFRPNNSEINPVTHTLTIADTENSRLQSLASGYRILNLIPSADVIRNDDMGHNGESLSNLSWATNSFTNAAVIPARLMFGNYVVADFTVDLTQDRDWSNVNVQTLPWDSKSLVVNLNQDDAPGISGTHSLYLSRYSNQTEVTVCLNAITLDEVNASCDPQSLLVDGANNNDYPLTKVSISGKNYWKIDNLEGTGAFSSFFSTTFALSDLMTRQKVSTESDHMITFGTSYDINHDGDTMTLGFGSDKWDLSTVTVDDIALHKATTNLNIGATAGVDTWGVDIDNDLHEIIFTAPTNNGSTEGIELNNTITVYINNTVLVNPDTAASYEITMDLRSSDGGVGQNVETGSVNVPIVDNDQVNITGFVNAFMSFDIDTGVLSDSECASNGCVLHGGTSVTADNYTVDLGELKSTDVNRSNDAAVMHSDGISGVINSIYFDLSTNAQGGAVVTVKSASDNGLVGPNGSNILPVDSDGDGIGENDGRYGFTVPTSVATMVDGNGIETNTSCDATGTYCGPLLSTPKQVFNTSSRPIDTARVRMDIAAAAAYTNTPGAYTDTLTFVATAEF